MLYKELIIYRVLKKNEKKYDIHVIRNIVET